MLEEISVQLEIELCNQGNQLVIVIPTNLFYSIVMSFSFSKIPSFPITTVHFLLHKNNR